MNEQPNIDVDKTTDDETTNSPQTELALLRERAATLGIPVPGNIGVETLKKRIADRLSGTPDPEPEVEAQADPRLSVAQGRVRTVKTKAQKEQEIRDSVIAQSMKLVRCRIYNLNPMKRDLQGEIITVGNKFLGTVRKFIPFGEATDGGYHIPMCIYNDLKARKYQQIRTKRVGGQIISDTRMAPEYNVEILPALTKDELEELALTQQAAQRVNAE